MVLDEVLVSHPLAALPSQSPKPALHEATAQAPVAQLPVPLAGAHADAAAAAVGSVSSAVSHPFAGLPSQSPKPGLHEATAQAPVAQLPVPLAGAQAMPQPPQLASVSSAVSQPFAGLPSQSPKPGLHEATAQAAGRAAPRAVGRGAGDAAAAAVRVGVERRLAAVRRVAVAVAEARVARGDGAGAVHAGRRGVREVADLAAPAAALHRGDVRLAAVEAAAVAVLRARRAGHDEADEQGRVVAREGGRPVAREDDRRHARRGGLLEDDAILGDGVVQPAAHERRDVEAGVVGRVRGGPLVLRPRVEGGDGARDELLAEARPRDRALRPRRRRLVDVDRLVRGARVEVEGDLAVGDRVSRAPRDDAQVEAHQLLARRRGAAREADGDGAADPRAAVRNRPRCR